MAKREARLVADELEREAASRDCHDFESDVDQAVTVCIPQQDSQCEAVQTSV